MSESEWSRRGSKYNHFMCRAIRLREKEGSGVGGGMWGLNEEGKTNGGVRGEEMRNGEGEKWGRRGRERRMEYDSGSKRDDMFHEERKGKGRQVEGGERDGRR